MRETFIFGGIIVGILSAVVAMFFIGYAFVAFFTWIASDPFNWINHPKPMLYVEPADFQLCRDKGGIPVKSGWTGNLKRCDIE